MKLKHNSWGIASRQGDTIWMNRKLKEYPKLYDAILQHEKDHSSGYVWNDFLMDVKNDHLKDVKKDYYKFIATHPGSLAEFIPFWFYEGKLVVNPFILGLYGFGLILIGGILWALG